MAEPLYGAQTRLAVDNLACAGRRVADVPALVTSLALVKRAAATANRGLGRLDEDTALAIERAATEVVDGRHHDQFPTPFVVGGGGTAINMNANEVIAARASQLSGRWIHPNDHVNTSQSTNDVVPSAFALTVNVLLEQPLAAIEDLAGSLEEKADEYEDKPYLGRTCLQDAVTAYAGPTLRAQSAALRRGATGLADAARTLTVLPMGATVLGTGIGAPPGFGAAVVAGLRQHLAFPVTLAEDPADALAHLDPYMAVGAAAARVSVTIAKIAQDLRLRSSGPGGGFAEVTLPALQAGSSIMPGKVNPVAPEHAMQMTYRVRGAAQTVSLAVAAGELELNVMEPVVLDAIVDMFRDLTAASATLDVRCVRGLVWDGARREANLRHTHDELVLASQTDGYDAATRRASERGRKPSP